MSVREFIKKLPGVAPIKGYLWRTFVNRHDKSAFLHQLKPDARILDVGCGNNSPFYTKNILPECVYTGLDIGDYNQSQPNLADQYVVTTPAKFAEAIYAFNEAFDAVISTHNLEHCDDRDMTVDAMLGAVSPGGATLHDLSVRAKRQLSVQIWNVELLRRPNPQRITT